MELNPGPRDRRGEWGGRAWPLGSPHLIFFSCNEWRSRLPDDDGIKWLVVVREELMGVGSKGLGASTVPL